MRVEEVSTIPCTLRETVSRSTKADQRRSHRRKSKLTPEYGDHFLVGLVSFVCDPTCQIFHSDRHFGTHSAGGAHNHGSKGAVVDICKVFTSSFVGDSSVVVGNGIREVALGKR